MESAALTRELQLSDVELLTFPARCAKPPFTWEELAALIPVPARFDKIAVIGAACLERIASAGAKLEHLQLLHLPHCMSLLCGHYATAAYLEEGAYLVNSGWLSEWQGELAARGIDPTATSKSLGSYQRIVHLDTGVFDTAGENLAAFGRAAGLPRQTVPVGLDLLRQRVEGIIREWRDGRHRSRESMLRQETRKKAADRAMALDLLKMIVQTTGSSHAAREILNLYLKMFAASELAYVSCAGEAGEVTRIGAGPLLSDEMLQEAAQTLDGEYRLLPSGGGFQLRVAHKGHTLGMIHIDGIAFQQNLEQYLDLALETVTVCAVVLDNALNFEKALAISKRLRQSEEALEQANRELEERVRTRTAELETTLHEQASFSYSVSHDLRAPLRHINSFSTILVEEYAGALPRQASQYLERICQSTRCMGELIDSLLELSRVGKTETEMKQVDLTSLARWAANLLQEKEAGHTPEFQVEEGLAVIGDTALLRQVLFNLLGNAWKFTAGPRAPGGVRQDPGRRQEGVLCQGQRRRLRHGLQREAFRGVRAAARQRVRGKRHRARHGAAHHPAPRRNHLGGR